MRALSYTLIIQLAFGFWTVCLVKDVGPPSHWTQHLGALSAYTGVVLLGVPVVIGLLLNRLLANAEAVDGPPSLLAATLGAGEARDAFDYAYQRWRKAGVYVIVELIGHTSTSPRLIGGVYGSRSAIGQTPSPHDIYLQALCTVDEDDDGVRALASRIEPERGVYIPASQIARIDLVPEGPGTL